MTKIKMSLDGDPEVAKEILNNPQALRDLCRKEVESFDSYLRSVDPQFTDGLARFEFRVVEGYVYQKLKGHIDAFHHQDYNSKEGQNGSSAGS